MNGNDNSKGLIQLSKEGARKEHAFNFDQIGKIMVGVIVGVVGWNVAQKSEKVRSVFNLPAELITNTVCKITGLPRDPVSLAVREVYDVFIFGPLIAAVAMLADKNKNKGESPTPH